MIPLVIGLSLALALILFFSLRVKSFLVWNPEGLSLRISFWGLQLFPKRKTGENGKADTEPKPAKKDRLSDLFRKLPAPEQLPEFLEAGLELLRQFRSIRRLDLVRVHYCAAGADPYAVVLSYQRVGNLLEMLDALLDGRCRKKDLRVTLDFEASASEVDVQVIFSTHILRYLTLLRALTKMANLYRQAKRQAVDKTSAE